MLRERNESYGTIKFVDISSDEYSPEENQGLDYKTVCRSTSFFFHLRTIRFQIKPSIPHMSSHKKSEIQ